MSAHRSQLSNEEVSSSIRIPYTSMVLVGE